MIKYLHLFSKKRKFLTLIYVLLISFPILQANFANGQAKRYDAIIVRGDLPVEWIIAQSYANKRGIPVLQLTNPRRLDENTTALLKGLLLFGGRNILILGDVIPKGVEEEIRKMGFSVDRIKGVTRVDTAAAAAVELWGMNATAAVLVDGWRDDFYMLSLSISLKENAPILFIRPDEVPYTVKSVLTEKLLNVKVVYLINSKFNEKIIKDLKGQRFKLEILTPNNLSYKPREKSFMELLKEYLLYLADLRLFIGLVIGVIVFLSLAIRFRGSRARRVEDFVDKFLTYDERRIFEEVLKKGRVKQEDLPKLTDLSKPTVSRILTELTMRNILKRERAGKTYIITVSDELRC